MRNILVAILLLLISTTAYAKSGEISYRFLERNQRLVGDLFNDVLLEFGENVMVQSMLLNCEDRKRADVIDKTIEDSVVKKFISDKITEKYEADLRDFATLEQRWVVIFLVNNMFTGYKVGNVTGSNPARMLDKENYCKTATDLYDKITNQNSQ